jgi:hypothetical protein
LVFRYALKKIGNAKVAKRESQAEQQLGERRFAVIRFPFS